MSVQEATRASATEIIAALACGRACCEPARRKGAGNVHCPVPAHGGDDRPSLSVTGAHGTTLVHCHGGCEQDVVIAELRSRGLWADRSPARPPMSRARRTFDELPVIDALYPYHAKDGSPVYRVVRYAGKRFEVQHAANGSGWIRGLGGAELVPYRLPGLAGAPLEATVHVVEGEKSADLLTSLGLVATTSPFGAGKWPAPWGERYFRGRRVVVLPDADEVGRKHARQVAESCAGHAASVRILDLGGLEHSDVDDWIADGGTVSQLAELAAAAPEYTRAAVARVEFPCTDMGNAERLVARHGEDLRYVSTKDQWYVWDGRRWRADDVREIERRVKDTHRGIYAEAEIAEGASRRKELAAHAVRSEAASKVSAALALARSDEKIALRTEQLDADPFALNVLNGTIDLRRGELRAHRRQDLMTKVAPVEYDPDARLDLWERFLAMTFGGDSELESYVQKAAGYSATADTREEVMFAGVGPTVAGKTSFGEALGATLGDYAARVDPETFLAGRRDSGPRADVARLEGRRLVMGVEIEEGRRLDEGLVKQLTGGDTVVARHLYRDHFEFRPVFKLWLFANERPRVSDVDDAIWRRVRLIPFVHQVPRQLRDPELKATLRDPRIAGPAILAWIVAGCRRWLAEGLGAATVIDSATEHYRAQMDPVAEFIAERCVVEADAWATIEELYETYRQWASGAGERRPLSKTQFGARLERRGHAADKGAKGVRIRRGIRLADQQRFATAEQENEVPL
ncbi:MAG TPA: phage/plasmid primase, P4 family [Candidatus Limnocylindria bacterium]|nr:phage/plasmid primase, P4 family [Candidatus Limnocylindria bacterium]